MRENGPGHIPTAFLLTLTVDGDLWISVGEFVMTG